MITAGFLPGCAAAWHRGVLYLVRAGFFQELPGADQWTPALWLGLPAAAMAAVAIALAASSNVRAWLMLVGASSLVQPWLPVALAPLAIVVRRWPAPVRLVVPGAIAVSVWFAGLWMTPPCTFEVALTPTLELTARALWATVGLTGAILLAIDAIFSSAGRRAQLAAVAVVIASMAILASGRGMDATAMLGVAGAVAWWRVMEGAGHVLGWQNTTSARIGAALLILLVPVLAVGRGRIAPVAPDRTNADRWRALDAADSPAVLMATGGPADTAAVIWRSGPSEAQQSLLIVPLSVEGTGPFLATRAVFAWNSMANEMAMRGMVVAPLVVPDLPRPLLWRVLQFEPCHTLTTAWVDAGGLTAGGQVSGIFPLVEPMRGALLYVASERPLNPQPLNWPAETLSGFQQRAFDRTAPADEAALRQAIEQDLLTAEKLGTSRFVTRVRFDRRATAPQELAVTLGGVASTAWARRYSPEDERAERLSSLCRSSVGQPLLGYPGAPATIALDAASGQVVGGGWHGAERAGDSRFRWTAEPEADLLFIAHRPQPLLLTVDAQPAAGTWAAAAMSVTINGTPARCRSGVAPCEWLLPAEAMRTGLNLITLHSTTVQAPAPDGRRLGLMVRKATLSPP